MNTKQEIQDELKLLSPSLQSIINNNNVFTVPEGYFDSVPVYVLGKLFKEEAEIQHVPSGYFDNFAAGVMHKIKMESVEIETDAELSVQEELAVLSPVLLEIGNKNVLTVPANYFSELPAQILEKVQLPVQEAKIVPMRSFASIKYLMAAACIGILGFGAYQFFNNTEIKNVTGKSEVVMAQAQEILKSGDLDAAFNNLSEADITGYLTSKGEDIQTALVASAINSPELPEAEDYLIDDNTLDDFLKTNNLTN